MARQGDFILYVLPGMEELARQARRISLDAAGQGQEVVVTAHVSGAAGLRGICMELAYPSARYRPVAARCGAALGAADEQLSLCVTDTPGVAALGAVLKNWPQREGFFGAGELAQVRFARQPFAAPRRASSAPTSDEAKARLSLDVSNARLEWECLLPGDYDQDGMVGVSDLAALAAHWGESGMMESYDYSDYRARLFRFNGGKILDGNDDRRIDLPDLTFLACHIGERIQEYWIYRSAAPLLDMPDGNGAPSKLPRLARAFYSSRSYDPVSGRFFMSIPLPAPAPGEAYWVRPFDGTEEGTPSNYAWYDTGIRNAFSMAVEPSTFIFGGTARFGMTVYTTEEAILLGLSVDKAQDLGCFSLDIAFDTDLYDALEGSCVFSIPSLSYKSSEMVGESLGAINCCLLPSTSPSLATISGDHLELAACFFVRGKQDYYKALPYHGGCNDWPFTPHPSIEFDDGTGILTWWYTALGDGNQDGLVMFDDIIQISYYWGDRGPFEFESNEMLVDSDQDATIGVHDVVKIAERFRSLTTGYYIYSATDPSDVPLIDGWAGGPQSVPSIGYVSFAEGQGNPLVDRLRFSANIGSQPSGTYLWVMPECNGEIGTTYMGEYVLVP